MSFFDQILDPLKKILPNLLRHHSSERTLEFDRFQSLEWPEDLGKPESSELLEGEFRRDILGDEVYDTIEASHERIYSKDIGFLDEDLLSITLKFSSTGEDPSYELNILMQLDGRIYMCLESYTAFKGLKAKDKDLVLTTIGFDPNAEGSLGSLVNPALEKLRQEDEEAEINSTTAIQLPLDDYPILSARLQEILETASKGKTAITREY